MKSQHAENNADSGARQGNLLAGWNDPTLGYLGRAGANYAGACLEWQQEIARFAGQRFNADMQLQQSLAACRQVSDVVDVQKEWATTAFKDYLDGFARLCEMQMRLAGDGMQSVAKSAVPPRAATQRPAAE